MTLDGVVVLVIWALAVVAIIVVWHLVAYHDG